MTPTYPEGHGWYLFALCEPHEMLYETFRARDLFPVAAVEYCQKQRALFWRSK